MNQNPFFTDISDPQERSRRLIESAEMLVNGVKEMALEVGRTDIFNTAQQIGQTVRELASISLHESKRQVITKFLSPEDRDLGEIFKLRSPDDATTPPTSLLVDIANIFAPYTGGKKAKAIMLLSGNDGRDLSDIFSPRED